MKLKKIFSSVVIALALCVLGGSQIPHVLAQSQTFILGPVTSYENKPVVESAWGGTTNTTYQQNSSCPSGSVMVGFTLYNMGGSYSTVGSLYCQSVTFSTSEVVTTTPVFDFSLTNDGNKSVTAGNAIDEVINTLLSADSTLSKNVTLAVTSAVLVGDTSGANRLNTTTGLQIDPLVAPFSTNPVLPANPASNSHLKLLTSSDTLLGTYTVTVTGTVPATSGTTVTAGATTPCSIVWQTGSDGNPGNHQYDGFYFGCSSESGFNPKTDYEAGGFQSTKCINFDEGDCKVVGSNAYLNPSAGSRTVVEWRRSRANAMCGTNNWTLTGNEINASTGFTCSSTSSTSGGTPAITKTTTFNVTVSKGPELNGSTLGGNQCVSPAVPSVTLTWTDAYSGTATYKVYRKLGTDATYPTTALASVSGLTYTDTSSLVVGTPYTYKIVPVISNVEYPSFSSNEFIVTGPQNPCTGLRSVTVGSCSVSPTTRTTSSSPYDVTVTASGASGGNGTYQYSWTDESGVWSAYTSSPSKIFTYTNSTPVTHSFQVKARDTSATPGESSSLACGSISVTSPSATPNFVLKGKSEYSLNGTTGTLRVKKNKPFKLFGEMTSSSGSFNLGCNVWNSTSNSAWQDNSSKDFSVYSAETPITQSARQVRYEMRCQYSAGAGGNVWRTIDVTAVDPAIEEF
ncbi:MAG: hypothetical protein HZA80_00365 [Candidatus Taylorbacteria bacterium]|nr:hypothetical protein [Candidatus Taylorbacteria bacterium]